MRTTEQAFGDQLHSYTIVDAINDKNVLPFRVDYIKTMDKEEDIEDVKVWDIDRERAYLSPKRISLVTKYILDHFDQKTYRKAFERKYSYNVLQNVSELAEAKKRENVHEIKQKQHVSGFNSIFAVSSVLKQQVRISTKFSLRYRASVVEIVKQKKKPLLRNSRFSLNGFGILVKHLRRCLYERGLCSFKFTCS